MQFVTVSKIQLRTNLRDNQACEPGLKSSQDLNEAFGALHVTVRILIFQNRFVLVKLRFCFGQQNSVISGAVSKKFQTNFPIW